jgi:hypothetical protein
MTRPEDPVLVQVRRPRRAGAPGAIFFLNTGDQPVGRTYPLADLGIEDAVYLYHWELLSSSDEPEAKISISLPAHHSVLYFFSAEPLKDLPTRLP